MTPVAPGARASSRDATRRTKEYLIGSGVVLPLLAVFALAAFDERPDAPLTAIDPGDRAETACPRAAPSNSAAGRLLADAKCTVVQVVDETGRPCSKAELHAADRSARSGSLGTLVAIADERGVIETALAHEDDSRAAWIHQDGYVPQRWFGESVVVLRRGHRLQVRLRDLSGGPVSECIIGISKGPTAREHLSDRGGIPGASAHAVFSGKSDSAGEAMISGLPAGSYSYSLLHPHLVPVRQVAPATPGSVEVPHESLECVMAAPLGARLELHGDQLLSHCWVTPHGLWLEREHGELRNEVSGTVVGSWLEFRGWPNRPDHEREVHLFALLDKSGPRRFDLCLVMPGAAGFRTDVSVDSGTSMSRNLTVDVVDAHGSPIGPDVTVMSTSGLQLYQVERSRIREVSPRDLAWGARVRGGGSCRLAPGRYKLTVRGTMVGKAIAPIEIDVGTSDRTVRLSAPVAISRVCCRYPATGEVWSLTVDGVSVNGIADGAISRWESGSEAVLWLPEGVYSLTAYSRGYVPDVRTLTVKGQAEEVEFAPRMDAK